MSQLVFRIIDIKLLIPILFSYDVIQNNISAYFKKDLLAFSKEDYFAQYMKHP